MIPWLTFERRWLDTLLAAMIPHTHAGVPGFTALDADTRARAASTLRAAAPPLLAFGVRAATWALTLSPLFLLGRPTIFTALDEDARDLLLTRAMKSRSFLVRQLVITLKLVACFEWLEAPEARAAITTPGATR